MEQVKKETALPGARVSLALLLGINLFNYIDRQVLAAVEPRIREEFFHGASEESALGKTGLLATAFLVSYLLTAPIFGWLADRMSRWIIVGASVLLWSLATGASGLAGTFTILLITRCFVGVGEAGYGPAAPTIIADLFPVRRRGRVMSWFYVALPLGAALGYIIGGLIEKRWGWRAAFYAVTAPGLIMGIAALFMREPPRGQADQVSVEKRIRFRDYLAIVSIPSFVLDTLAMAAMTFAIGGIQYFMPAYLVWRNAGDLEHVNLIFGGIVAVGGIVGTLTGGVVGDRLRSKIKGSYFIVSGCGILVAAPLVVGLIRTPFPTAWVFVFLAVFFLFFNTGPSSAILVNVTHPSIRATAFAINIFIVHLLGDAASPPVLGHFVGPFKVHGVKVYYWNAAFVFVSVVMGFAGLIWLSGARFLSRDTMRATGVSEQGQKDAA